MDATIGWIAYILSKTAPDLVDPALERYYFYHDRSIEATASRYEVTPEQAVQMARDGVLLLNVPPNDIVKFFIEMTQIVQDAGFDGLVVIADELQQYLEPEIKSGKRDPLAPLFDIITELVNLQGRLAFGLLLIITSKELGVINDQRGDLIDRLRGNTLDLRAIYDHEFPLRLWARFAETFDYMDIAEQIIAPDTLIGLGQIATRQDLSNGPRTVINVFRRVAQRALEATGKASPYSPIDLIDDFLTSRISFDARKTIQEATIRALNASFIRGNSALECAVKLTAAFPQDGVNQPMQQAYGLTEAFAELKASGFPEVVVEIGDRNNPAITLRELNTTQQNTDEITLILREFARHYQPQAENQIQRAINSFPSLLRLIFKNENWSTYKGPTLRRFAQNNEVVYEGAFPDMERTFPDRFVYVRVLGDDEHNYEANFSGECKLVFYLDRHLDVSSSERADILGDLNTDIARFSAIFSLNLMLPCFDTLSRSIQDALRRVVDIEQVTPLMVLALHAYLGDVINRKQNQVTKATAAMIETSMRVRLLEGVIDVLLNPSVGADFHALGRRLVEQVVIQLIEARYGDRYRTLMTYKQWRNALRDYIAALNQLDSFAQKQGITPLEGSKDDIAKYFSTTGASFDAFQSRIADFLKIEGGEFPSRADLRSGRRRIGGVRFTYHPLEEIVLSTIEQVDYDGKIERSISVNDIYALASDMGYREAEIEFILEVMEARDVITVIDSRLIWKPRPTISLSDLATFIQSFKHDADMLHEAIKQEDTLLMTQRADQYILQLRDLKKRHKETELIALSEQTAEDMSLLRAMIERALRHVANRVRKLQLDYLPQDWLPILSTPIRGTAYTNALNQARVKAEQMCRNWEARTSLLREQIEEFQGTLDHLSLESLKRTLNKCSQFEVDINNVNQEIQSIQRAVEYTRGWDTIAQQQIDLLTQIQQLGEPAALLQERLYTIEHSIIDGFADNRAEAFASALKYQSELERLSEDVKKFSSQAENRFNRDQAKYRELLIQLGRIQAEALWNPIIYSPLNPEGIYGNLFNEIRESIATILDDFYNNMEQTRNSLIGLTNMPDAEAHLTPEQIKILDVQLAQLNEQYSTVADNNTLVTIQTDSRFEDMLRMINEMRQSLSDIQQDIQALRNFSQNEPLSADEAQLLDIIKQYGTNVDLVIVWQALDVTMTDSAFWAALKSLWEKQQLSVRLTHQ